VKAWEECPGEGGKDEEIGWKVRRKDASELRCLTVRDILSVCVFGRLNRLSRLVVYGIEEAESIESRNGMLSRVNTKCADS